MENFQPISTCECVAILAAGIPHDKNSPFFQVKKTASFKTCNRNILHPWLKYLGHVTESYMVMRHFSTHDNLPFPSSIKFLLNSVIFIILSKQTHLVSAAENEKNHVGISYIALSWQKQLSLHFHNRQVLL